MDAHPFGNYRSPMVRYRGTRLDLYLLTSIHGGKPARDLVERFDPPRWKEVAASLERLVEAEYVSRHQVGKRDMVFVTALGGKVAANLVRKPPPPQPSPQPERIETREPEYPYQRPSSYRTHVPRRIGAGITAEEYEERERKLNEDHRQTKS